MLNEDATQRSPLDRQKLLDICGWVAYNAGNARQDCHSAVIHEKGAMKIIFMNLRTPAIISAVLVLPFMILELINRRGSHEGFPIPLFAILWLLPAAFILILMPIVRSVRAGNRIMTNPSSLLLRVPFLILITWLWTGIILDQMPCFLGVPNCD